MIYFNIDKTIYYNRNCAQSVPDKTLELWKHFKHIHLDLSIDDMNERVEYIRYPVKWEQFIKFLNWCDNDTNDNVTIEVLPSVANYNIFYYPDFVNWMVKQKFKKVKGDNVVMSTRDLFERRKRRNRYAINIGANVNIGANSDSDVYALNKSKKNLFTKLYVG